MSSTCSIRPFLTLGYLSYKPLVTMRYSRAIHWPCSHTVGQQITILVFVSKLYQHLPMGKDQLPPQPRMMGNSQSQEDYPTSDHLPATPIIAPPVAARTAHSSTNVSSAELTTVLSTAQTGAALLNKPKPWTPI